MKYTTLFPNLGDVFHGGIKDHGVLFVLLVFFDVLLVVVLLVLRIHFQIIHLYLRKSIT